MTAYRRVRRFLVRTWPLLLSLALLGGTPALISLNRQGRVAVEASIYLPDMVLQVPAPGPLRYLRPVTWLSDPPIRTRVTINYQSRSGPRSIDADLYLPAHGTDHQGVVFSMGAPPLPLDDPRLRRIADDSARSGVVMLVPFSTRLDDLRIEPEEIDALVAEFQYVQQLPQVNPHRVGFFGASVGGSLALVAAADPRIAADVDQVVSFGAAFDALAAFGAIVTHHIQYDGINEAWTPRRHAEIVVARQLIDRVDSAADRDLLTRVFLDGEQPTQEQLATLTPAGRSSYNFLANRDPAAVQSLIDQLPASAVADLEYLSPRTSIANVKAELFIIHDRADPFIPFTESLKLKAAVGNRPNVHFDEVRLFQHVQPKLNQQPQIIAIDGTRLLFRLYQLLLSWD
ncbi:MAG TPA: acetylxylan esterase [Dehalococcoidia bacterium]|nr:acetylxylan esterase [Dehalococcoidia bacterium]